MPAAPCVDPDWNEVWRARQRLHASSQVSDDPGHDWNRRENAARYDANSRGEYDDRVRLTLAGLDLDPGMRVLDIGSGPGTLAIPLAPRVKEVAAVEPGAGMVAVLQERAAREGIANIACIPKRWEDVDTRGDLAPPYDLVIASLSLTMEDIRAAIEKMNAVSRRDVCLYWFADMPFWERMYADLWQPLHGLPYHPGPKADCLFAVLFQMGIYANVEMLPLGKEYRFADAGEMLTFFFRRFDAKTPAQQEVVRGYLAPMIREDDGGIIISGDSTFAKIWWRKAAGP